MLNVSTFKTLDGKTRTTLQNESIAVYRHKSVNMDIPSFYKYELDSCKADFNYINSTDKIVAKKLGTDIEAYSWREHRDEEFKYFKKIFFEKLNKDKMEHIADVKQGWTYKTYRKNPSPQKPGKPKK
jgi:hypothetical protein